MVTVRTATLEDFADCRQFEYDHTPDDWLSQAIQNGWVYIADANDATVGYARLEFIWMSIPYIGWIVVSEAHRGKGIGTAIVHSISEELAHQGHTALYSSSEVKAERAQAFHRHCGFQECGIIINHLRFLQRDPQALRGGVGEVFFIKALGED